MSKTPKLRFKEFSGDWESKCGESIATKITKGSSPKWQGFNYQSEGVLFITSENVRDGYLDISEPKYLPLEFNEKQKSSSLVKGDILINIVGASIGRICEFNLDNVIANVNQAVCVFRVENKTTKKFINYHLQTPEIKKVLFGTQTESARPNLSLADIRGLEFNIPKTEEEQEKIAYFFSLIDDKISLQGEKVEALKDYKKGMMQKIFSRELRFKDDDGRDYPEWEVTTIEKVADLEKGFTPDTKNEKNWIGDIPWLSIADMKQGKYISDVSKHISDEALGNKKLVPKGTLIMSFKLTLGRLGIINREMMTNEAICHFYWRNKSINTEYMYYYLSTVNIESFGCRAAKGITLNNDSLNSIVVKLPVIEEQNKIADILMKIDRKVEKEQEKLDSLNEYKKGLLQQMFV